MIPIKILYENLFNPIGTLMKSYMDPIQILYESHKDLNAKILGILTSISASDLDNWLFYFIQQNMDFQHEYGRSWLFSAESSENNQTLVFDWNSYWIRI